MCSCVGLASNHPQLEPLLSLFLLLGDFVLLSAKICKIMLGFFLLLRLDLLRVLGFSFSNFYTMKVFPLYSFVAFFHLGGRVGPS